MYRSPGLRRALSLLVVGIAVAALGAAVVSARPPARVPASSASRVAIFFYPWYGTPARDGSYQHWSQHGHTPPASIASSYFPARGVYSSSDPAVLRAQMADIASMHVGVVIVSWWGTGSPEDKRLPAVMAAAKSVGLRTAIHIEPYDGRTPQTVAADVARLRTLGIRDFYVYDSSRNTDTDWAAVNIGLSGVRLFANTSLPGKAAGGAFAGFYTYDVYIYDGSSFARICASGARAASGLRTVGRSRL